MLWGYLGPASLAGLALLIGLVVMNVFLASKVKKLQVKTMRLKDKRTKQTNEILNGIKVGASDVADMLVTSFESFLTYYSMLTNCRS